MWSMFWGHCLCDVDSSDMLLIWLMQDWGNPPKIQHWGMLSIVQVSATRETQFWQMHFMVTPQICDFHCGWIYEPSDPVEWWSPTKSQLRNFACYVVSYTSMWILRQHKAGGIKVSYFKAYFRQITIKRFWFGHRNRHMNWNLLEAVAQVSANKSTDTKFHQWNWFIDQ